MDDPTTSGGGASAEPIVTESLPAGDLTAEPDIAEEAILASPEILAQSLGDYMRAWWQKTKSGESGALPILIALVAIVIFFQLENSVFLGAANLTNLLVQATIFILLGAAEIYALILSEIDLSIGFVAGVTAMLLAELIAGPVNFPWWLGIIIALSAASLIGFIQGSLITRLQVPSFIVTLAGLLILEGAIIEIANVDSAAVGGVMNLDPSSPIWKLVNSNMSVATGWIVLVVVIALYAAFAVRSAARKRAEGLSVPPLSITLAKIAMAAIGGIVVVYICSLDRSSTLTTVKGVPYVVPFVGIILMLWSILLGRTRTGRYIYAIGANPEAARRAGISVAWVRTFAFTMCSLTAGIAGIVYLSRLSSISIGFDGSTYVLYAVGAAVIGGASLFGGRGKPIHALLGGMVIATVFNGLALIVNSTWVTYVVTGGVLLIAATVDARLRRRV